MTHDDLTKSFRVIETWATEARRASYPDGDFQLVRANLAAIQIQAQKGIQATLTDARKLAAFDGLLAAAETLCHAKNYTDVDAAMAECLNAIAHAKE